MTTNDIRLAVLRPVAAGGLPDRCRAMLRRLKVVGSELVKIGTRDRAAADALQRLGLAWVSARGCDRDYVRVHLTNEARAALRGVAF